MGRTAADRPQPRKPLATSAVRTSSPGSCQGHLAAGVDPDDLAITVLAALQGELLLAHPDRSGWHTDALNSITPASSVFRVANAALVRPTSLKQLSSLREASNSANAPGAAGDGLCIDQDTPGRRSAKPMVA
jgi:hypothetical protein